MPYTSTICLYSNLKYSCEDLVCPEHLFVIKGNSGRPAGTHFLISCSRVGSASWELDEVMDNVRGGNAPFGEPIWVAPILTPVPCLHFFHTEENSVERSAGPRASTTFGIVKARRAV